jgi:hypothetical protein
LFRYAIRSVSARGDIVDFDRHGRIGAVIVIPKAKRAIFAYAG